MKLIQTLTAAVVTLMSTAAFAGDLNVACYKGLTFSSNAVPLVSFQIANNASNRLISGLEEVRSATDSQTLPSILVSQYKFQPLELLVEMDDFSTDGNQIASLQALYIGKKAGEKARYLGAYKRMDAGRELNAVVTCVVKE